MSWESVARASDLLMLAGLALSTVITIFLWTLPTQYDPFGEAKARGPGAGETSEDDKFADRSRDRLEIRPQTGQKSVQIVVLGDIGRSPRMQYHAVSFAKHGGRVDLIGYLESEVHPEIKANTSINVVPLVPTPSAFQTGNKLLFLALAPLKVLWQIWTLYHALGYRVKPAKYILVQNPPSIPTLVICTWTAFFRCSRLVIDWHNFGYSILALKLGPSHLLVRVSKWYEGFFARQASAHLAVTDAMVRVLKADFGVEAKALHDRPATHFKPLSKDAKAQWLKGNASTKEFAQDLEGGSFKLMVSSTSWTADEDFSILLDALCSYSTTVASRPGLPKILAIITGKGPQKEHYLSQIRDLNQQNKLQNVVVSTCWLSVEDYSSILGAADLGVSLHTSSSGVDLPMKVVDMFGAGLPVAAAKFDALPELVKEGINGRSFSTPKDLVDLLVELFSGNGTQLGKLKEGAMEESERRWDDEWVPIAGKLFQLNS